MRLVQMGLVDPLARKVHQRRQASALADSLGFGTSHEAHGSGFVVNLRCPTTQNLTHSRINPKTEYEANVGRPITLIRNGNPIPDLVSS